MKTNKPLSKYKKELDKWFSKYIRQRDSHICYTCGKYLEANQSQCGHFVPRQYLALRYSEVNCHCQCYACNLLYNGQPSAYAKKLIEAYGEQIISELELLRRKSIKFTADWYEERIAYYKKQVS